MPRSSLLSVLVRKNLTRNLAQRRCSLQREWSEEIFLSEYREAGRQGQCDAVFVEVGASKV
jgi:hypothetical protein